MSSSKSSKNGTSNVPPVDFMARGVEAPLEKVKDSFCEAALKEEATERTGEIWKGGAATNGLSGESLGKPSIFLLGEGMMRAEFSIKENPWFAETSLRSDCCAKRDVEDLSCLPAVPFAAPEPLKRKTEEIGRLSRLSKICFFP